MAANIVGALAVELGLDTAQFEKSLKSLPGLAQQHFGGMSAEMKRTSREGAESFRLIDEALGIHLSRPITKLLTEEFPGLAKGLQAILGVGLTGAIAAAAFEVLSSAVEKLIQKFEQAKKAQEEYESAARHLSGTLQDVALSHEKRLLQLNAELAALSGDKQGALADKIKIASIEDADLAIQQIDKIAEAMERMSKAALEAETASHRFWLQAGRANASEHNLGVEDAAREFDDFKEKVKEAAKEDATKGTRVGVDLTIAKVKELDDKLAEVQSHRISDFRSFIDDLGKATFASGTKTLPGIIPDRSGFTDKEISQIRSQDQEAHKFLETQKQISEEHEKRIKVLKAESAAEPEIGSKEIEKLKSETAAELLLAAAVTQTVAEQRLLTASGEASQLISRILEEAHGRLTSRIKEEISVIHALTAERQFAKDAVQTNQDIQKQIIATEQQIDSESRLATAYRESSEAVLSAKIEDKLAPQIQAAKNLREEYERLKKSADDYAESARKLGGAAGPKQGIKGIEPEALATAKNAADEADRKVEELRTLATVEARKKYQVEIEQNDAAIRGEGPLLERLGAAYLENSEAVRKAQVQLALYHWEQAHPGASAEQINQTRVQLEQQSQEQQRLSDIELASRYSINRAYDEEITKLQRAKEVMQEYGQDTLLIDAQIQDAQRQFLQQWDDAAFKVGTFHDKFKAVMNEVVLDGEQASERMARSWLTAIDGINSELAKLATGQKADFKHVVTQLAEEQTKGQIQKLEGTFLHSIGFGDQADKLTKGKPDGTKDNPLHVRNVDGVNSASSSNPLESPSANPFAGLGSLFTGKTADHSPLGATASLFGGKSTGAKGNATPVDVVGKADVSVIGEIRGRIDNFPASFNVPNTVSVAVTNWPANFGAGGSGGASSSFDSFGSGDGGDFSSSDIGGASPDFSSIPNFGGFRANGGDMTPGYDYIVGEKGPELLRIPHAGTMFSNADMRNLSTTSNRGGDVHGPTINQTFNGIKDNDMFRRTTRQEHARMFRNLGK